ncbi:MAG: hypothetical protein HKN22_05190, partial [Bacteroidia bacterium]|nr:hypothetical protein [Bacteroidia bacterium]
MKEQELENLFKDAFENFEAPVDASVWAGIEEGLNSPSAGSEGASASNDGGSIFGSLSSGSGLGITAAGVGAVAIAVLSYFALTTSSDKNIERAAQETQANTEQIIDNSNSDFNTNETIAIDENEKAVEEQNVVEENTIDELRVTNESQRQSKNNMIDKDERSTITVFENKVEERTSKEEVQKDIEIEPTTEEPKIEKVDPEIKKIIDTH